MTYVNLNDLRKKYFSIRNLFTVFNATAAIALQRNKNVSDVIRFLQKTVEKLIHKIFEMMSNA